MTGSMHTGRFTSTQDGLSNKRGHQTKPTLNSGAKKLPLHESKGRVNHSPDKRPTHVYLLYQSPQIQSETGR